MCKFWLVFLGFVVLISGCAAKQPPSSCAAKQLASSNVHRQLYTILIASPEDNSAQCIEIGEEIYASTKDQDKKVVGGTSVHYLAAWGLGVHYFRTGDYRMAFQMFDEVVQNLKKFKTDQLFIQQTCILYGGASMVRLNKNEVGKNIFAKLAISDGADHRTAWEKAQKRLMVDTALKLRPKGTVMLVDFYCKAKKVAVPELIWDVLDAYSQVMPLSAECIAKSKVD